MLEDILTGSTILGALLIFALRIVDVSLGTLRTISLVQGRTFLAMALGFGEVLVWIVVISEVMSAVKDNPVLLVAYAAGFAAGNGVGILIDRRVAIGREVIRLISAEAGDEIAGHLRRGGQPVTTFAGMGRDGPVTLLYVTCNRRDSRRLLADALKLDPGAFYVIEPVTQINRRLSSVSRAPRWRGLAIIR